jgi:hypothetical protein
MTEIARWLRSEPLSVYIQFRKPKSDSDIDSEATGERIERDRVEEKKEKGSKQRRRQQQARRGKVWGFVLQG